MNQSTLHVIDSHTEGEPTRVVISGGPDLGGGPLAGQAERFQRQHQWLRGTICNEPRGHDAMVGALLCESDLPDCACGVIFFNNVGTLGMCIHGTIGVVVSLVRLGKIGPGCHRIDTPVGVVTATLSGDAAVEITNVPSHRLAAAVAVTVPGWGTVRGDIAWGGNWFFLIDGQGPPVTFANREALTGFARSVRTELSRQGVTGENGAAIEHIEVFGPPGDPTTADSRNFVLCPGDAYDRSPCGTGTSAKLACLHAAGKLEPGRIWRQAGILDTVFEGAFDALPDHKILPRISGRAWVTGEATHFLNPSDPFRYGIPATH